MKDKKVTFKGMWLLLELCAYYEGTTKEKVLKYLTEKLKNEL